MVPTVAFPPGAWFTCQLTAELDAFCTTALNCTLTPGKGCAEFGVTVTVTGGGGEAGPEPTAPQEVQIMQSRREAKRSMRGNFRDRRSRRMDKKPRGRHSPRCRSNGLGMAPPNCVISWRVERKVPQHI